MDVSSLCVTSVSVVVPAYEAEQFVATALESVVAQTRRPDEVIVVDDGSRDRTAAVASEFADRLNLRVVSKPRNEGPGLARRDAIELATSDTIALLDADDCWRPDHLKMMLEAYEGPGTIVSAQGLHWDGSRTQGLICHYAPRKRKQRKAILSGNFVFVGSLFSRQACLEVGNFREYTGVEDWDLWIRMIHAGARVVSLRTPTVLYRVHKSSLSGSSTALAARDLELLEDLLAQSTAGDRRRLRRAVRFRHALIDLVAARDRAEAGDLSQARRLYFRAAVRDRTLRRSAPPNGNVTMRGLVGLVAPTLRGRV